MDKYTHKVTHPIQLNIMYCNIRSLRNKIDELEVLIDQHPQTDIIILTETWLYTIEEPYIHFRNFETYFDSKMKIEVEEWPYW